MTGEQRLIVRLSGTVFLGLALYAHLTGTSDPVYLMLVAIYSIIVSKIQS